MKRILFIFLAILPSLIYGQPESKIELAKFIITDAKYNGVDNTSILLNAEAFIIFYTTGTDELLYMANVRPYSNSQSFGPIYKVESKNREESDEYYKTDFIYFNWQYANTFNDKTGTAQVQVTKIYKPQGVEFVIKIIPENLDEAIYKGDMNGTIDFSIYD